MLGELSAAIHHTAAMRRHHIAGMHLPLMKSKKKKSIVFKWYCESISHSLLVLHEMWSNQVHFTCQGFLQNKCLSFCLFVCVHVSVCPWSISEPGTLWPFVCVSRLTGSGQEGAREQKKQNRWVFTASSQLTLYQRWIFLQPCILHDYTKQ